MGFKKQQRHKDTKIFHSLFVLFVSLWLNPPMSNKNVAEWLRERAISLKTVEPGNGFIDMAPLKELIGNARIVALGESTHGSREIFQIKHRMLEFLVKEMGFSLFGIEASFPDCIPINDYVLHGRGDPKVALHNQGFWTWDTEEVLDLILWMRRYNEDPAHEIKLKFYGFDMQAPHSSLNGAFAYLERTDPEALKQLSEQIGQMRKEDWWGYFKMAQERRDEIEHAISKLLEHFDLKKEKLIEQTSEIEWTIARRQAVVAKQFEEMARTDLKYGPSIGPIECMRLFLSISASSLRLREYLGNVDTDFFKLVDGFLEQFREAHLLLERYKQQLTEADREQWDSLSLSLLEKIDEKKEEYINRLSEEEWASARKQAIDIGLLVGAFREFQRLPDEPPNVRDRSMAENVAWILEQEGPGSRIVLWAHNAHVTREPSAPGTGSMGSELARLFADDYFVFGFSFNQGAFQAISMPPEGGVEPKKDLLQFTVGPALEGSVDEVFSQAKLPFFIADLCSRPDNEPAAVWLYEKHKMRSIGAVFAFETEGRYYNEVILPECFDAIIFIDKITRARPVKDNHKDTKTQRKL
jgi:erythromycin esterase-like protein